MEESKTKLEIAVRELEIERELRERFVAALTHDLRTPLTAAKMSAQMLTRKEGDVGFVKKMANRIGDCMDRADSMIRDLLDASRIKAGESMVMDITEVDLNALAAEVIEDLTSVHGDRFVLDAPDLVRGHWDPEAIRRILENLSGNAVKYGALAPVTLRLKQKGEEVAIQVHNEGEPIPEASQARLFEPFQRGTTVIGNAQKGWGIGLTLVKGLAEAHGGNVSLVSNAAEGTTFTVRVPLDSSITPA